MVDNMQMFYLECVLNHYIGHIYVKTKSPKNLLNLTDLIFSYHMQQNCAEI